MKKVAIYSRKSKFTGKGDSIENQIQICKDYIHSTIKEKVEFIVYEDEGFSGGNLDRPEFKKLMKNLKNIDVLICYKLDRISRNVADFSSTLETLQADNCSFISVSEQFDTSSPMGRAMIYIASVFAQLERETIAERVKDNMLEMAKHGAWTGGKIPLGFDSERVKYTDENGDIRSKPKLIKNNKDSELVEFLYKKYLELGSLHKLEVYCFQHSISSPGGSLFEKSSLKIVLQNPVYAKADENVFEYLRNKGWNIYGDPDGVHSLLTYNKTEQTKKNGKYTKQNKPIDERFAAISSAVEGFIEPSLWLSVQKQFDENRDTFPRLGKTHNALLVGKLRCGYCKNYMLVQHGKISKVTGQKLFYYVCSLKRRSHKALCKNKNAKASDLEDLVILSLKQLAFKKKNFMNQLRANYCNDKVIDRTKIDLQVLESNLNEKKHSIDNLLNKLASTPDKSLDEIIFSKISTLKNECTQIEKQIDKINNDLKKSKMESINLQLIDSVLDKCKNIDHLTREEQKSLIDVMISTVYYYGPDDNNPKSHIKIKFIGDEDTDSDENEERLKLQFGSPSTCYVNLNATFKKVFKPIDISKDYDYLPETTLAEKIKKLRLQHGLTQRQFAKKCKIGYTSLCKYESGYNASEVNIRKICKTFKVKL